MKPEQIALAVNPFFHHSCFCPWLTDLVAKKPSGCMQYLDQKCSRNSVYLRFFFNHILIQQDPKTLWWHERRVKICHFHTVCNSPHLFNPPVDIKPVLCEAGTILQCQGGLPLLSAGMWHLSAQCQADVVGNTSSCPRATRTFWFSVDMWRPEMGSYDVPTLYLLLCCWTD